MKVTISSLLMIVLLAAAAFGADGSRSLTLDPSASGWIIIESIVDKRVTIRAKTRQGSFNIRVLDESGRAVASGAGRVSFRSATVSTTYKVEVTNNTNRRQKVVVSWIIVKSTMDKATPK